MFIRFKHIKIRVLIVHLIITLAYPVARAFKSEGNRLMIFNDALTIIGLILIVLGVAYTFILHGDFDHAAFYFLHGIRNTTVQDSRNYAEESKVKREDAFNYPLFLGIVFLLVSVFIAYVVL